MVNLGDYTEMLDEFIRLSSTYLLAQTAILLQGCSWQFDIEEHMAGVNPSLQVQRGMQ